MAPKHQLQFKPDQYAAAARRRERRTALLSGALAVVLFVGSNVIAGNIRF
jgi:hypothetical protein